MHLGYQGYQALGYQAQQDKAGEGPTRCTAHDVPHRRACLPRFDFGEAGRLLYEFVWSDFADWYIEAAKARLYGGDETAAAQVGSGRPWWWLVLWWWV